MANKRLVTLSLVALATAPTASFVGDMYFNTVLGSAQVWDGSVWKDVSQGYAAAQVTIVGASGSPSEVQTTHGELLLRELRRLTFTLAEAFNVQPISDNDLEEGTT